MYVGSDDMKVGIMTFPNSTSYGAVLQMYALYSTLTAAGCKTEVINFTLSL